EKWVGWLTVSATEIRNYRTDEYYMIDGQTVTRQNIKSALCLPWPATLSAGPQRIFGFARSPGSPVVKVEWSADDGDWAEAELLSPREPWGWVRFALDWNAAPGDHVIRTRATDQDGQMQPQSVPFNPGSMMYNAIIPHPLQVA
ncbi:MAG: hypothetical protein AAF317_21595, partial [Pseudomonadota bacterium]